jgi:hypothetical protein
MGKLVEKLIPSNDIWSSSPEDAVKDKPSMLLMVASEIHANVADPKIKIIPINVRMEMRTFFELLMSLLLIQGR